MLLNIFLSVKYITYVRPVPVCSNISSRQSQIDSFHCRSGTTIFRHAQYIWTYNIKRFSLCDTGLKSQNSYTGDQQTKVQPSE